MNNQGVNGSPCGTAVPVAKGVPGSLLCSIVGCVSESNTSIKFMFGSSVFVFQYFEEATSGNDIKGLWQPIPIHILETILFFFCRGNLEFVV